MSSSENGFSGALLPYKIRGMKRRADDVLILVPLESTVACTKEVVSVTFLEQSILDEMKANRQTAELLSAVQLLKKDIVPLLLIL